tara:strand:+ start:2060 stop:2695 length:636 start_codon:yes stop_codon:yes gene_type:complete
MEEPLLATEANPTTEGQTAEPQDNSLLSGEQTQQEGTEGQEAPKSEAKEQGAPESYEFKTPEALPEGAEIDERILTAYSEAAKEANLPQEKAQGMLDKVMGAMHQQGVETMEAQRNEWAEQARKDSEFGGKQLDENLGIAKKALDQFGSDSLQELLNGPQGLGNHPELIRFMVKVGKSISEDGYVGSNQGKTVDLDDVATQASRLYPSTNK